MAILQDAVPCQGTWYVVALRRNVVRIARSTDVQAIDKQFDTTDKWTAAKQCLGLGRIPGTSKIAVHVSRATAEPNYLSDIGRWEWKTFLLLGESAAFSPLDPLVALDPL